MIEQVSKISGARLSDALCGPLSCSTVSLTPLRCNISAIEACKDFAIGKDYLVALVGPSGWGKSLLLRSVSEWMTQEYGQPIPVWNTLDYLRTNPRGENLAPIVLDDIQEAVRQPRTKHELRSLLERRIRLRRPTLVSMTVWDGTSSVASSVPCADQWTLGTVLEPQRDEKRVIISEMARLEGVLLSPELVGLMAAHLYGNGCSIAGALHCLKLVKTDWSYPEDIARACGTLMSFLTLDSFDPYGEVIDSVQSVSERHGCYSELIKDISCYLMVAVANFGEDKVANQLRVEPREVYAKTNRISTDLTDPAFSRFVESCQREVLARLSRF